MAAIMGKDGDFRLAANTVALDSWTLNPGVTTAEHTDYGDSWEAHSPTIKNWNGTATGSLDRTNAEQATLLDQLEDAALADASVRFYTDTTTPHYWSGTAIVESWSINSAVKDRVSITFNLKGNGALAYT